jgi:hypothetical protein
MKVERRKRKQTIRQTHSDEQAPTLRHLLPTFTIARSSFGVVCGVEVRAERDASIEKGRQRAQPSFHYDEGDEDEKTSEILSLD